MRRVYPLGTTVMCILVPVLMLLAVVFLLYQHEFAVQTIAPDAGNRLRCSAQSRQLLHARSGDRLLLGRYGARCRSARADRDAAEAMRVPTRGPSFSPAKTNYALTCAVLVLSIAAIAVSLFAGLAYYVIWARRCCCSCWPCGTR